GQRAGRHHALMRGGGFGTRGGKARIVLAGMLDQRPRTGPERRGVGRRLAACRAGGEGEDADERGTARLPARSGQERGFHGGRRQRAASRTETVGTPPIISARKRTRSPAATRSSMPASLTPNAMVIGGMASDSSAPWAMV